MSDDETARIMAAGERRDRLVKLQAGNDPDLAALATEVLNFRTEIQSIGRSFSALAQLLAGLTQGGGSGDARPPAGNGT
jgi:hypothetical protein